MHARATGDRAERGFVLAVVVAVVLKLLLGS